MKKYSAESSGLKDLALWYPEQNFSNPIPYTWTVQQRGGLSSGMENITIVYKTAIGIKVTSGLRSVAQFQNVIFEGRFKHCVMSI